MFVINVLTMRGVEPRVFVINVLTMRGVEPRVFVINVRYGVQEGGGGWCGKPCARNLCIAQNCVSMKSGTFTDD